MHFHYLSVCNVIESAFFHSWFFFFLLKYSIHFILWGINRSSPKFLLFWKSFSELHKVSVVCFGPGHTPFAYSNLVQSLRNPRIWLLQMDTINQQILQGLESTEKQRCLHVASYRQASVWRVSWLSADLCRRFPFALTGASNTLMFDFLIFLSSFFLLSTDYWQGECGPRLPP